MNAWKSIHQIADDVRSGRVSASKLVEKALQTINDQKDYQAIIATTEKRARQRAKDIDARIKNGDARLSGGRLVGVPFIAKDNFLTFGSETTAASNILKGFQAPYQATAIERLEAEGAICVAKANMDAFGHGSSTENSDFMTTKNPHDNARVPGGSSGGPAASVVLDMVPFAVGTDTGGSNRQPASLSGCVGYRPTYGLISRSGVVAMVSSADTIGPLTKTVEDAALVLDVMAGRDELDSTTIEADPVGYQLKAQSSKLKAQKFGVIKEHMAEGVEPGVRQQIEIATQKIKAAGGSIQEVSLPSLDLALAAYYIIAPAEISSNLSRYDGQRFGYSDASAKTLEESYNLSRSVGFGNEAKRRIMIGTYVLSSGYYDAYYRKAQIVRTKLINEFNEIFKKVDILLGPTSPVTAFKIGEKTQDPLQMYLVDIMTVSASLVGIPAISIPAGKSAGLPVGLQLTAPAKHDRQLLATAATIEGLI